MIDTNPIISIGMPVYNGEKYIKAAIESLINQTFTNFELLISDNYSQDDSERICREFERSDSRIKYVRQESNIGATANFKFVLEQARGEYFMWAACDDLWSANWLEKLYNKSQNSKLKMIFGSVSHIDENGKYIKHPANNLQYNFSGPKMYRKLRFFVAPEYLGKANAICSIYHISFRPYMKTFLDFYQQDKSIYDYIFLYNMLSHVSIESVKDAYMYKRIHNQSEGGIDLTSNNKKLIELILKKARFIFNPLPYLIQDYYVNSNSYEKVVLVLFLPLKTIVTAFYKLQYWIYFPKR